MCRVIQAQLPRSESSARQAARLVRATVEEWLPDIDPAVAEAAEQMTRALVTNAVVHALSPVRLVIALRGGVLEVGVSDTDATLPGSRVPAPRVASRGWGRDTRWSTRCPTSGAARRCGWGSRCGSPSR
jgi:hypothetical protein